MLYTNEAMSDAMNMSQMKFKINIMLPESGNSGDTNF